MKPEEIIHLLPAVYQQSAIEDEPLMALIKLMATLHEPSEDIFEGLDRYFSPYRTDVNFLPYLGSWFLLDQYYSYDEEGKKTNFPTGFGRLRQLIENYSDIAQWRGTSKGLVKTLELATGITGFQINEAVYTDQKEPKLFHIEVNAPAPALPLKPLIKKIILSEKPAYVTYELKFVV